LLYEEQLDEIGATNKTYPNKLLPQLAH